MNCVLLDLDGTIANTEILKAKGLAVTIRSFGGEAPESLYKLVMGQSWENVTRAFFEFANIKIPIETFNHKFKERYQQLIDDELSDNLAFKDCHTILKKKNIKTGLVTSASSWMTQKVLGKLQLLDAFDTIVTGSDTKRHKPDPEAYLIALHTLGTKKTDTIAIEDSESGFKAANAAGLKVYGINHAFNETHDFSLCENVFQTFSDFQQYLNL